jgi:Lipase (class 3).
MIRTRDEDLFDWAVANPLKRWVIKPAKNWNRARKKRREEANIAAEIAADLAARDNVSREQFLKWYPTTGWTEGSKSIAADKQEWPETQTDRPGFTIPNVDLFNKSSQFRDTKAYARANSAIKALSDRYGANPANAPALYSALARARGAQKKRRGVIGKLYDVGVSDVPSHPEGDEPSKGSAIWRALKDKGSDALGRMIARNAPFVNISENLTNNGPLKKIGDINKAMIPLVLEAWRFCYSSYRPGAKLEKFNYKYLVYNDQNAGFIAKRTNKNGLIDYVFAFRGTQSNTDTGDDIASGATWPAITDYAGYTLPIPVQGAYGPAMRAAALDGQLTETIQEIVQNPDKVRSILVTGHSLGGGTAAVFAAILVQLLPIDFFNPADPKFEYVSFEAMRGLTETTVKQLTDTVPGRYLDTFGIRIFNDRDPVPKLPPQASGFAHIGEGWMLSGRLTFGLDSRGFKQIADKVWDEVQGPHSMNPTTVVLDRLDKAQDDADFDDMAYVAQGRGSLRGGKKISKRKGRFVKGSKEAKLYMARLRAMRRK